MTNEAARPEPETAAVTGFSEAGPAPMDLMTDDLEARIRSARILIIDDKPLNLLLFRRTLENAGFSHIIDTTDPRQALELYRTHSPDLVLLDIRMPYLDGFAVMEHLTPLAGPAGVPIIVVTAQSDRETRILALRHGASDFLGKPIDPFEVLLRIRNQLQVRALYRLQVRHAEALEAEVHARTRELRETQLEIVRRLGRAGEFRDNETGMHVMRMSKSCQHVALAMGRDEGFAELMLNASPMHDVGKIGIPDRVLLKSGPLDEGEWRVMKTHTLIGATLLASHSSELVQTARAIAIGHHEKFDGSGYPYGLAGSDIPEPARIAAVCDVFDALLSERPYKKPWTLERAVGYMRENAGSHFDPAIIKAFLATLPGLLDIRARHREPDEALFAAPA